MNTNTSPETIRWADLLNEAITTPGLIHEAYSRFHRFSFGNQLLAASQCRRRKIQPGPIHTFVGWKELGRFVRKGEKALTLCMPVTSKRKRTVTDESTGAEVEETYSATFFTYKNNWFVLSQTDGEEYTERETLPEWDKARALKALQISEIPFDHMDGNAQGFARKRSVSVSPLAVLPFKTLFHELAHVALGHTAQGDLSDTEKLTYSDGELEAEAVALLCCETLGLPGAEYSRGYIQGWTERTAIPEKMAQRIMKAADQILRAGRVTENDCE